jgi:V/A-type H+-transporting ATPase subunit K
MELGLVIAIFGGVLAVFLCGIGSSIGIGYVGQESAGVLSEDPEKFGKLILLVALPGTQGFYGLVTAFLVIMKTGLLGGNVANIPLDKGLNIMLACCPIAFAGLFSAIHQGKVCAAGAAMVAKRPEEMFKGIMFGALVETYAVVGLVTTILFLNSIKL